MTGERLDVHFVSDYIINEVLNAGALLNTLKLQKLLYYVQAWHLAFYDERLFEDEFQAWVHGPVCRTVYDRFARTKSLYSDFTHYDKSPDFAETPISLDKKQFIDAVLEAYGKFSGTQLESLTHQEDPWIKARSGYGFFQNCENIISDEDMAIFYRQRLNQ